jgi:putative beta-lysine N-acetyltransferase
MTQETKRAHRLAQVATLPSTDATSPSEPDGASQSDESQPPASDEWGGLEPTDKDMGVVQFVLDKGVKTTVVGTVYGLDFEIEGDGYTVNVFFDYYNRRLKVVHYDATDYTEMIRRLAWLAESNDFDKIFVKAGSDDFQKFLSHGYMMEGVLRYYFRGEDAYVLSRFSSTSRVQNDDLVEEAQLVEDLIYNSEPAADLRPLPEGVDLVRARKSDIPALVSIYRSVFETYPSPLTSADFIKSTMERDVFYRMATKSGEALAVASADVDRKHSNAEMTDCATFPHARGQGLMQHILLALENDLREQEIMTAYTLARAGSVGMNRVFFRLGYEFSGRLVNNCDIFGQFEDMNIWVKRLSAA